MSLLSGLNHVAVVTADLERFVQFYTRVFGLDVVFREATPKFQHAILRIGRDSWLHPVQVPGNRHAAAVTRMLDRGHLDHLALTASSAESFEKVRAALIGAGASDGSVENLGAFHTLWFEDPDGMRGEITLIVHPELQGIHEPRPLTRPVQESVTRT